jgi:hypothetical protein
MAVAIPMTSAPWRVLAITIAESVLALVGALVFRRGKWKGRAI